METKKKRISWRYDTISYTYEKDSFIYSIQRQPSHNHQQQNHVCILWVSCCIPVYHVAKRKRKNCLSYTYLYVCVRIILTIPLYRTLVSFYYVMLHRQFVIAVVFDAVFVACLFSTNIFMLLWFDYMCVSHWR